MDLAEKLSLVKEVGEEIVTEDDLKEVLKKKSPIAYDGFEPSGNNVHIAQGLLRAININKMAKAGFRFKILVADWHAWANNKMGGNLEHIQKVGEYMTEVWKACGLDTGKVEYIWASELVKDDSYWKMAMQVATNSTVKRIVRCAQIMGRQESESLQASPILYPCMQAADIFYLKADVTQLGMDQRKVNMLAREIGEKLGFWKPVVVSHHMLMGLGQPPKTDDAVERAMAMKMSKSKPETAIFMNDSQEGINAKLRKAYCPEGIVEENPVLEYCRYIIFEKMGTFRIERPEKFGGNAEFESYAELESAFAKRQIHPMDLKSAVASCLNQLIEPVRENLEKSRKAKELAEEIRGFKVTR